ncbi:MAG TPA: ABC-2 transporter permease [Steroidobacteraceae bacterium]|nr:ABC-2 transporter permease [Steroidobacteraceae bacterium]
MNPSVFWALVRKDLYLLRGFMLITALTGVLCLVLISFGKVAFAVGGVLFLTADIASGIFIAMYSLLAERKGQARAFALSLPISGFRYELSKLVSGYLAFGIPWLVLTALALGVFLLPGAERGMIVYALLLQMFVVALFSVMLAALLAMQSEGLSGVVILVVNICFSLFVIELNLPQNTRAFHGPAVVWTRFATLSLSLDAALLVLTLGFSLVLMSRRRDYV